MGNKEGRRIKSNMPMDSVMPFIMPTRSGSSNKFSVTVDISACERLIREKRAEGLNGFGMIHIIMTAYARVISKYPGINRFIRGQRLYARNNIEICMAIKKELKLNAPETVIKIFAMPDATLDSVYKELNSEIELNRPTGDHNSMDTVARILVGFPRLFLRFIVGCLKGLDYFGCLPRFLTKLSPFHGSMFITNMASLGMPPIYHHLYDFGNLPVFIAMGKKRIEYVTGKDGVASPRKVMDFTFVCDERICDGHYYSQALKALVRIMKNPEQLTEKPAEIVEDIK